MHALTEPYVAQYAGNPEASAEEASMWSNWDMPITVFGMMQLVHTVYADVRLRSLVAGQFLFQNVFRWEAPRNVLGVCNLPQGSTEGGISDSDASLRSPESTEQNPI